MSRARKPGGPAGLSPEDAALFDAAMRDVDAPPEKRKTPKTEIRKSPGPATKDPIRRPAPPVKTSLSATPLSAGKAGDVDNRTMDRLRRGQLRPEARLDLHGMTQDEAHRALTGFVERSAARGARSILVITGKGRVSEGGGILRNQFPGWLNSPPIRPLIIGFAEAQPRDGGGGAFYVLLRRKRPVKE